MLDDIIGSFFCVRLSMILPVLNIPYNMFYCYFSPRFFHSCLFTDFNDFYLFYLLGDHFFGSTTGILYVRAITGTVRYLCALYQTCLMSYSTGSTGSTTVGTS